MLIVIDGASSTVQIAETISSALGGYTVVLRQAESFAGTDLLPASAFILGCENPGPASFTYLEELLGHINLAGRRCGVFSAGNKALEYLAGLVRDSEAAPGEPLLAEGGVVEPGAVQKWLKTIFA